MVFCGTSTGTTGCGFAVEVPQKTMPEAWFSVVLQLEPRVVVLQLLNVIESDVVLALESLVLFFSHFVVYRLIWILTWSGDPLALNFDAQLTAAASCVGSDRVGLLPFVLCSF